MQVNYSINVKMDYLLKDFETYENGKLIPKYIIIHDTAGQSSALNEAKRLQSRGRDDAIAHYYVDDNEAYQLIYDDIKAFHAGDSADSKGNGQSIGIEVCKSLPSGNFTSDNQKEIYKKALDNAYKLAADLCKAYNINPSNILQHNECNNTSCPYTQKVLFGSYEKAKSNAINKVNKYFGNDTVDTTSASEFDYKIISDKVYKSTTNHLGHIDYDLGYLEKNDRFDGHFESNYTEDGFDWYKVTRVKNYNDGSEYYVSEYWITKQGMNVTTGKPDGTTNFVKN